MRVDGARIAPFGYRPRGRLATRWDDDEDEDEDADEDAWKYFSFLRSHASSPSASASWARPIGRRANRVGRRFDTIRYDFRIRFDSIRFDSIRFAQKSLSSGVTDES